MDSVFLGYDEDPDAEFPQYNSSNHVFDENRDVVLYEIWRTRNYLIYIYEDEDTLFTVLSGQYMDKITLPECPSKKGYVLEGYSFSPNSTWVKYKLGSDFTVRGSYDDWSIYELYAVWYTEREVKLTFDGSGIMWTGSESGKTPWNRDSIDNQATYYVETATEFTEYSVFYENEASKDWLKIVPSNASNSNSNNRFCVSCNPAYITSEMAGKDSRSEKITILTSSGEHIEIEVCQYLPKEIYITENGAVFSSVKYNPSGGNTDYLAFKSRLGTNAVSETEYYGFDGNITDVVYGKNNRVFLIHREYKWLQKVGPSYSPDYSARDIRELNLFVDVHYTQLTISHNDETCGHAHEHTYSVTLKEDYRRSAGGITDITYSICDEKVNAQIYDCGISYNGRVFRMNNYAETCFKIGLSAGSMALDLWTINDPVAGASLSVVSQIYGAIEVGVAVAEKDNESVVLGASGLAGSKFLSNEASAIYDFVTQTYGIYVTLTSIEHDRYENEKHNDTGEISDEGVGSGRTDEAVRLSLKDGAVVYVNYIPGAGNSNNWVTGLYVYAYGKRYPIKVSFFRS